MTRTQARTDLRDSPAAPRPRWPKKCIRITILNRYNKARNFLSSLGFDIQELYHDWRINFCHRDPTSDPPVVNRIIAPVYDALNYLDVTRKPQWKFAGWQALSPGETGSLASPDKIMPKGMVAHGTIYGLEKVYPGQGPVVLVNCVIDVWRLGRGSISTFGEEMSPAQIDRIVRLLRGRPIVLASNRNACESSNESARRIVERREQNCDWSSVHVVHLPTLNEVFSESNRQESWSLIRRALEN